MEDYDYLTRASKTVANRHFESSGRLYLRGWFREHDQAGLYFADDDGVSLEGLLPELFKAIEVRQAQRSWDAQEHERKRGIKQLRWDEIFAEAKVELANDRLADQLHAELDRRRRAIEMHQYAGELEHASMLLAGDDKNAAQEWVAWIRAHADRLDPRHEPIAKKPIGPITRSDIDPYMRGWGTWRP